MAWEHSSDKKLNNLCAQDFLKLAQETWVYFCVQDYKAARGVRGRVKTDCARMPCTAGVRAAVTARQSLWCDQW